MRSNDTEHNPKRKTKRESYSLDDIEMSLKALLLERVKEDNIFDKNGKKIEKRTIREWKKKIIKNISVIFNDSNKKTIKDKSNAGQDQNKLISKLRYEIEMLNAELFSCEKDLAKVSEEYEQLQWAMVEHILFPPPILKRTGLLNIYNCKHPILDGILMRSDLDELAAGALSDDLLDAFCMETRLEEEDKLEAQQDELEIPISDNKDLHPPIRDEMSPKSFKKGIIRGKFSLVYSAPVAAYLIGMNEKAFTKAADRMGIKPHHGKKYRNPAKNYYSRSDIISIKNYGWTVLYDSATLANEFEFSITEFHNFLKWLKRNKEYPGIMNYGEWTLQFLEGHESNKGKAMVFPESVVSELSRLVKIYKKKFKDMQNKKKEGDQFQSELIL